MKNEIKQMIDVINTIIKNPDKTTDALIVLKDIINKYITPNNECIDIMTSRNSNDPFYAIVIPAVYRVLDGKRLVNMSNINDLMSQGSEPDGPLTRAGTGSYYIDIDINRLSKINTDDKCTAEEMVIWLMHELAHNVLTSTTRLRLEMLLMNNIDQNLLPDFLSAMDREGLYLWADVHSRTYKEKLTNTDIKYEADKLILFLGYKDTWNDILEKYINEKGGNPYHISESYNDSMDIAQLKIYKSIIRDVQIRRDVKNIAYMDTLQRMNVYVSNNIQSNLFKRFVRASRHLGDVKEKDSFIHVDDNNVQSQNPSPLNESFDNIDYLNTSKAIDEIVFEIQDIRSIDDKIALMYKIREWMVRLEKISRKNPNNQFVVELKEKLRQALIDVNNFKIEKKQYGVWIQDVPKGYEG